MPDTFISPVNLYHLYHLCHLKKTAENNKAIGVIKNLSLIQKKMFGGPFRPNYTKNKLISNLLVQILKFKPFPKTYENNKLN